MRTVVTYPSGARLRLGGHPEPYLPDRTCIKCLTRFRAPYFLSEVRLIKNVKHGFFKMTCMHCVAPKVPKDIHGIRLTSTYVNDDGLLMGWRQRTKHRGCFGPCIALEYLQLRNDNGVICAQPAFDRSTPRHEHLRATLTENQFINGRLVIRDSRRNFSKEQTWTAARRQHLRCLGLGCDKTFGRDHEPHGDHNIPWVYGGPTIDENCLALCGSCNSIKGARSMVEWAQEMGHEMPSGIYEMPSAELL